MNETIRQLYERKYARFFTDRAKLVQTFCARKYNSAFSREMSRSAEVYLQEFLDKE